MFSEHGVTTVSGLAWTFPTANSFVLSLPSLPPEPSPGPFRAKEEVGEASAPPSSGCQLSECLQLSALVTVAMEI